MKTGLIWLRGRRPGPLDERDIFNILFIFYQILNNAAIDDRKGKNKKLAKSAPFRVR